MSHQQHAQLRGIRQLPMLHEEHTAERFSFALGDPAALAHRFVIVAEIGGDAGHERLEARLSGHNLVMRQVEYDAFGHVDVEQDFQLRPR